MPDHTIAENLARLQTARTNISTAITTKGGTVPSGAGFEDFPTAIASIPEGTGDHDLFGVPSTAQNPKLFTATFTTTGTTAALAKMAEYWPFDEVTQDGKYYWGEDNYFSNDANDAYVYAYNGSTYLNYFGSMSGESDKTVVIGENFFLGIFSRVAIFCGYAEDEDGLTKKCIGLIPFTDHSDPVCFAFDDGERIFYKNQYYGTYGSSNAFNQYTKILYGATKYTVKDLQIMLTWQYRPTDPGAECTIGDDQAYLYSSIAALAKTPTAHAAPPIEFESDGSNLKNWAIFGNDPGVGEQTKNYAKVETGTTSEGITFTFDHTTGTITANGTATGVAQCRVCFNYPDAPNNSTVPPGNYYFSGTPTGGGSGTYNCYSWDNDAGARSKRWDGTTASDQDNGQGNCQVQINGHKQTITMRIATGYTANNVVFKPMLRPADTSSDFEPYGYKIPVEGYSRGNKNFLKLNKTGIVSRNVTFTPDFINGVVRTSGTNDGANNSVFECATVTFNDERFLMLNGCADGGGSQTYSVYAYDNVTGERALKWDKETVSERVYRSDVPSQVYCPANHEMSIRIMCVRNVNMSDLVFSPMLYPDQSTSEFEPYYVKQNTTPIYTQTQLGTGDTITKEQTGVDIPTVDGENYITVATTTQPAAMTIAYSEPEE